MDDSDELFATAAGGTEGLLRDELRALRFRGVRAERGGVHFRGDAIEAGRACLTSRLAMRVLVQLATFEARDARALYDGVRHVDWKRYLTRNHSLAVRATSARSALAHTQFVSQKTKDAIVDQLRESAGARPSVNRDDPDVGVTVRLAHDHVTVFIDASGAPLHRRGYRPEGREAPIKETLAAAILRWAGWDGTAPFVDPMCGAGTLPIEASMMAQGIAPGIFRPKFGLERWASADRTLIDAMATLRAELRAGVHTSAFSVRGEDRDATAVEHARKCAGRAGVGATFDVTELDAFEFGDTPGVMVVNPPYGERLSGSEATYRALGAAVKRAAGWRVIVLAGAQAIPRAIPVKPVREHTLWNGPIECRVFEYRPV